MITFVLFELNKQIEKKSSRKRRSLNSTCPCIVLLLRIFESTRLLVSFLDNFKQKELYVSFILLPTDIRIIFQI